MIHLKIKGISIHYHRKLALILFLAGMIQFILCFGFQKITTTAECSEYKSISQAIKEFAQGRKRIRLAVLDFNNTTGKKTQFDGFIADSIVTELSKYPLTLLERKRLRLLLTEHSLSLSGVIDSKKALKMGMLLPVDMIVSGSYTQMDRKIMIHGRFIHVGSGEIVHAFSCSLQDITKKGVEEKIDCDILYKPVLDALGSLKNKKEIKHAVRQATKVPFEGECGKIHFKVMSEFKKHSIFPREYKQFLIQILNQIETPTDDTKTKYIMGYFTADQHVDQTEWKACIRSIQKARKFGIHIYLSSMLNNRYEKGSLVRKRVDEIIKLGKNKKIGRPIPIPVEDLFFSILSGLGVLYRKNMENPVYLFKKYQSLIPDSKKYNKKAMSNLETIYFVDADRKIQEKALDNLITFCKSRKSSDLIAEMTADIIRSMDTKLSRPNEKEKIKTQFYKKDLKRLNQDLAGLICHSVKIAKNKGFRSTVTDRTEYVLKHNISCKYTPTISDLESDMRSKDWKKKLYAIELLSKIDREAKKAEKTIIKYLGQQGYGRDGGRLRRLCALTLGNIKTTNSTAIRRLIGSFPDYDHGVSHEAKEAVKKIGIDALPYLIEGLAHEHHAVRYGCSEALGLLGDNAKKAIPKLKEIAKTDKNPYVRKQAAGALQMITNDF